jgi:agmatinase
LRPAVSTFDPNAPAAGDAGIFGLPTAEADAALVLLPVPWEATTSYGGGTAEGPAAILRASHQVDLYDLDVEKPYAAGIFMLGEADVLRDDNALAKERAQRIIQSYQKHPFEISDAERGELLADVLRLSEKMNGLVRAETFRLLSQGKLVGIVGGDHSVPLGAMEAAAELVPAFGVLHFDAHSDTRDAYEGFRYSHASIMRNVCDRIPAVKRVVQVGIRDFCEEEMDYIRAQGDRMAVFFDRDLAHRKFRGESWASATRDIIAKLPQHVWVSFDIDGLDPRYCPHTGTPVPGGLDFSEAVFLLREMVRQGRTIIGFDLNEVAPNQADPADEWDGNVAARLLYKLCAFTLASNGKAALRD